MGASDSAEASAIVSAEVAAAMAEATAAGAGSTEIATAAAVISGGGAAHEPVHSGLVGAGPLTAAVCGDVFALPAADAVLAAILAEA